MREDRDGSMHVQLVEQRVDVKPINARLGQLAQLIEIISAIP